MKHKCTDARLWRLIKDLIIALEDPAIGLVFDDFDFRYREKEHRRDKNSAEWFYHDKTPFETKYDADCRANGDCEPAWVSDDGSGAVALHAEISDDLDDEPGKPNWLVLWRRQRRRLAKKQRAVLDALAEDWRNYPAAKIAGVDHRTVSKCKKFFKVHFAQCFQAWNEDSAF